MEADLASLEPRERELVESVLAHHPLFTPITALYALRAA
jgi:hypothetical protein